MIQYLSNSKNSETAMLPILHLHFDQVGLLTSALMEEDLSLEQEA